MSEDRWVKVAWTYKHTEQRERGRLRRQKRILGCYKYHICESSSLATCHWL